MKNLRKIMAIVLALVIVCAFSVTAFAAADLTETETAQDDTYGIVKDGDGVYVDDEEDILSDDEDGSLTTGDGNVSVDDDFDELFAFLEENTALFVVFILVMFLTSFTPILFILMIVFIVMNSKTKKELNKYKAAYPYYEQPFNADAGGAFNQGYNGQNMNGGESK